jgi:threonine dehydrogenase-like Zn-dependent dehydrogenase
MKVLAGDWAADTPVVFKRDWRNRPVELWLQTGIFKIDKIPFAEVASADLLTEENRASILGKVGWGALGAFALGPLGLLAGVIGGGRHTERVIIVALRDGRKAMIKANAKDAETLVAASFQNGLSAGPQ